MQAFHDWTAPAGTLGRIVQEARARSEALVQRRGDLERAAETMPAGPSLERALRGPFVALLTEVKRQSPSKGAIAPGLDAVTQARAYAAGGAAGVSVLTEPNHFGGSNDDLLAIRREVQLPALKKDFHVAPIQLLEARSLGASAALLIVRALEPALFQEMMGYASTLGLEVLVEVRDERELERALSAGATMVGVNNRNLETLEIDPTTAERVIALIPPAVIAIAESGIQNRDDVMRYAAVGADAVLVGSSLSAASDPASATRAIADVPRSSRAS